jgi:rhodanese-related sulfurtransferase
MNTVRESMRVDDLGPAEAYDLLKVTPEAQLVDVRRTDERIANGAPSLDDIGRDVIHVVWPTTPDMSLDAFAVGLERELEARSVGRDSPILFLCRAGARSRAAAALMTERGWTRCINVAGGFSVGTAASPGWADQNLPISKI